MATAKLLKGLRLGKNRTQAEVAARLGTSQATYSQIERGVKPTRAVKEAIEVVRSMSSSRGRTPGGNAKAGRRKQS